MDTVEIAEALSVVVLWLGFGYAALSDWRRREVEDTVWQLMGVGGAVLGFVGLAVVDHGGAMGGWLALGAWALVAAFVLEHLVPWDQKLAERHEGWPGVIEVAIYALVGALLILAGVTYGVGAAGLPYEVVAVYVSVLFGRALFEVGLLYGGADAKAVMVAGLVVPLWPHPWLPVPATASAILGAYPFSITVLMDGALFAAAVPIAIALRNLRTGDFELARGFLAFPIPVRELPQRFVWLKDPTFDNSVDEADTSEDDREIRERQASELTAHGVERVWVTPQIPFVILLAAGAVAAIVLGNVVFDVAALL